MGQSFSKELWADIEFLHRSAASALNAAGIDLASAKLVICAYAEGKKPAHAHVDVGDVRRMVDFAGEKCAEGYNVYRPLAGR